MTITIHRGTPQIGACVTEYSYDGESIEAGASNK